MATFDVTVRGAGVFGLSVAFCCAKRGAKVRVIDPNGVAAGASGGVVGALAPHAPDKWNSKKQFQFESLHEAESFWQLVEETADAETGYARTGRLQPLLDERAVHLARERAVSAQDLWGDGYTWKVVGAAGDWVPQSPTGLLIQDTLTARIHPRAATQALAKAVVALGGQIALEGPEEGKVVLATGGSGLQQMSEQLAKPVGNGVKGQAAVLDFDASDRPQLFADGLHIVPHWNGTVAIGSTSERLYEHTDVDDQLDDVIARAKSLFPVLAEASVIERWAGLRPRAKSRAPMLGAYGDVYVANGGFKIGFGMAPRVGETMAALVLDGVDEIPDAFRVEASL